MSDRKGNKRKGTIFESIRKPTAPSSQKFGPEKRDDKLDPVQRKVKHKKKQPEIDSDADI